MQQMHFDPSVPIYVASGIFQTDPDFGAHHLPGWQIWYGRQLLQDAEIEDMDLEQMATIDFLVAAKAAKFIGWAGSSFSFWVPQERAVNGLHNATSHIIYGEKSEHSWQDDWLVSNSVIP